MNEQLQQLLTGDLFTLIIKIVFLIFIGMNAVYAFILFTQTQALQKIVFITSVTGSKFISLLTGVYLLMTLVLFLVALAIL